MRYSPHQPTMKKILFAVDLSEPASVTRQAEALAEQLNAELLVLHVVTPAPVGATSPLDPVTGMAGVAPYTLYEPDLEADFEHAEEEAFQGFLRERFRGTVRAALRRGDAADIILQDAEEQDVDMLMLGRRHRNRLEEWLMGSVAREVLKKSERATLILPIPA